MNPLFRRFALLAAFPSFVVAATAADIPRADPIHCLVELSTRTRIKPFHLLADKEGNYSCERVVFKDTTTGATVWRFSRNPGYNRHFYSNVPVWSMSGADLMLRSARDSRSGYWLVPADGSRWRWFGPRFNYWSTQDDHTAFIYDPPAGEVSAADTRTGARRAVWKAPFTEGFLAPPSVDGKKLLLLDAAYSRTADRSFAWLIPADGAGQPQKFDLQRVVHQTWFLKRPDYAFMFNYEVQNRQTYTDGQFLCEPAKGGAIRQLSARHFSHAGVNPSGTQVAHFLRDLMVFDLSTGESRSIYPGPFTGGHLSWQCDDRWLVASLGNSIHVIQTDGKRSDLLCVPNSQLGYSTYYTEVQPVSSPDGTKVGYASSMLGDCDFYTAVQRRPDPPRAARFAGNVLTWQPPEHARELAGYFVYANGKLLNREPLKDTRLTVSPWQATYVVTAVERSGLESARPDALAPPAPASVMAKTLDPFTVELIWQPSPEPDVAHYNVYCGAGSVKAEQARRVASPTVARTIDWGLRAGTDYHYLVTAVDRQGNESAPSALARVATPKIEIAQQTVTIGRVAGSEPVEVEFRVPRGDDYVLWLQLKPVNVGNRAEMMVTLGGDRPTRWQPMWDFVCTGHGAPNPVPFWDAVASPQGGWPVHRLRSGTHKLTLRLDRGQAEVQTLIVTNDHGYVPEGITSFLAKREGQRTR